MRSVTKRNSRGVPLENLRDELSDLALKGIRVRHGLHAIGNAAWSARTNSNLRFLPSDCRFWTNSAVLSFSFLEGEIDSVRRLSDNHAQPPFRGHRLEFMPDSTPASGSLV